MKGVLALEEYDSVVVGAGVAGSLFSYFLACKGYRVALVERKPKETIGLKVCGDAIGVHHFSEVGLSLPSSVILNEVQGAKVFSPSGKYVFYVEGKGIIVDRLAFGQYLLNLALSKGVELYDNCEARSPLVEGNKVVGVKFFNKGEGKVRELRAKVVVDASGVTACLRRKLPREWWVSEGVDKEDLQIAYREIRNLRSDIEDVKCIRIHLDPEVAPGGYWWFFPRGPREVNIGLGVQWREGAPNPKEKFYAYLASMKEIEGSKVIHAGGGLVPTRRPLSAPVASGFLAIGDAALTCNPLHGGGIGPAMLSAKLAAESVSKALSEGNTDIRALWTYPIDYFKYYGYKQAALDIFRAFLQSLSKEEIEFGMAKKLVKEEEVYRVGMKGDLELSLAERALRALKALPKPSFLLRLSRVAKYMKLIKELYLNYPSSPDHFEKWLIEVRNLLSEYYRSLNIRKA